MIASSIVALPFSLNSRTIGSIFVLIRQFLFEFSNFYSVRSIFVLIRQFLFEFSNFYSVGIFSCLIPQFVFCRFNFYSNISSREFGGK